MYIYEHFKLEMCTYGKKGAATQVTDVTWKEGCRVPDILATEVVDLIERGIITGEMHENRKLLFEATLVISNIPKGSTIDDIKKLLRNFENEFYAEKRGSLKNHRNVQLHFYNMVRARDALTFIRNTQHQFNEVEMVTHKKQIGTNSDTLPCDQDKNSEDSDFEEKKTAPEVDEDGFAVVTKRGKK